jgi:hypothetical protein
MPGIRVNIIGKSNGVGLSRDLDVLDAALQRCGCEVSVIRIDGADARRRRSLMTQLATRAGLKLGRRRGSMSDINLMLEHVWLQYLGAARCNVAIPNPEWFDRHDRRFLSQIDRVWAKTGYTQATFAALGCSTGLIGFDSDDRFEPAVARQRTFFHLAGKSKMKGTDELLRIWGKHPKWPRLIVVRHAPSASAGGGAPANIEQRIGYLNDAELKILQNQSMFHLCLSRTEGWGHYIVEALSVRAVTITVDAAPMNELVTLDRGLLVAYAGTGTQRLATTYSFDEHALEMAVECAMSMSDVDWARKATSARDWFIHNKHGFTGRLQAALRDLSPEFQ